jgi:uncharacterized protein (TIGR02246 family)
MTDGNETSVRSTLEDIYEAFADNDADAYVSHYDPRATVLTPGQYFNDRESLRSTLGDWFDGGLAGARGLYDIQGIRFVGSETAIVITKAAVLLEGQTEAGPDEAFMDTWVLALDDDRWQVQAFHSCEANPR